MNAKVPFCYSIANARKVVNPEIPDPVSLVERRLGEPMKVLIQNCKVAGMLAKGSSLGYMYHHDNEIPEEFEGFDVRYASYQEKKDFLAYVTEKIKEASVKYHDRSNPNDGKGDTSSSRKGGIDSQPPATNNKAGGNPPEPAEDNS